MNTWFVIKKVRGGVIEFLDKDRDVFYLQGVEGYASQVAAQDRAWQYKGDDTVHILSPRGKVYPRKHMNHMQNRNTDLLRFEHLDKCYEDAPEMTQPLLRTQMQQVLENYVRKNGLWVFTNLTKTRKFIHLLTKYNVISDEEIGIYARETDKQV